MVRFLSRYRWQFMLTLTFNKFPGQFIADKQVRAHIQWLSQCAYGRRWRKQTHTAAWAAGFWEGNPTGRHIHILMTFPTEGLRTPLTLRQLRERWHSRRGFAHVRGVRDQRSTVEYVVKSMTTDSDFTLYQSLPPVGDC